MQNADKLITSTSLAGDICGWINDIKKEKNNVIKLVKRLESLEEVDKISVCDKIIETAKDEDRFCTAYFVYLLEHHLSNRKNVGVVIAELGLTPQYRKLNNKNGRSLRAALCRERIISGKLAFGYDYTSDPFKLNKESSGRIANKLCGDLSTAIAAALIGTNRLGYLEEVYQEQDRLLDMIDYDAVDTEPVISDDPREVSNEEEEGDQPPHKDAQDTENTAEAVVAIVPVAKTKEEHHAVQTMRKKLNGTAE